MRSRSEHYSTDLMDRVGDNWRRRAACRDHDPELWFALPGTATETYAKQLCNACPVQAECLDWATETGQQFGIWAGQRMEDRQRKFEPHYRICAHCRSAYWCTAGHQQYCDERCQNRAAMARRRRRDRERRQANAERYGNDLEVARR